jgi:hypothetical protein
MHVNNIVRPKCTGRVDGTASDQQREREAGYTTLKRWPHIFSAKVIHYMTYLRNLVMNKTHGPAHAARARPGNVVRYENS